MRELSGLVNTLQTNTNSTNNEAQIFALNELLLQLERN